jgi:hypothetical protein
MTNTTIRSNIFVMGADGTGFADTYGAQEQGGLDGAGVGGIGLTVGFTIGLGVGFLLMVGFFVVVLAPTALGSLSFGSS